MRKLLLKPTYKHYRSREYVESGDVAKNYYLPGHLDWQDFSQYWPTRFLRSDFGIFFSQLDGSAAANVFWHLLFSFVHEYFFLQELVIFRGYLSVHPVRRRKQTKDVHNYMLTLKAIQLYTTDIKFGAVITSLYLRSLDNFPVR